MKRKYIVAVFLLVACFFAWGPQSFASSGKIQWYPYKEGMALGKSEGKKVFLHFYADWCGYCVKMEKTTLRDPFVVNYLNTHFIPIRVNADREKKVVSDYSVRGLPATWFISETGETISNQPGYVPPDMLGNMLKYIQTDSYKTITFNDFIKACK